MSSSMIIRLAVLAAFFQFECCLGSIQSLYLHLDNPAQPVLSGRPLHQINFTASIHHSGNTPDCQPWELYMWISNSDVTRNMEGNSYSIMQVMDEKQKNQQLQEGRPAYFEHLTYGANLKNVSCEDAKFLCGRFLGLGSNARCSSAVESCVPISCKAVLEVQSIEVVTDTPTFNIYEDNLLNFNITIDYNHSTAVDISSSPDLWTILMWLSPYSNGTKPRWGFEDQILTSEQSSQGLVIGEEFGFTDVMYEPNMEELEDLQCDDIHYICARFRSNNVRLEGRRGSIRTSCIDLPQCYITPETTTPLIPTTTTQLPTTLASTTEPLTTAAETTTSMELLSTNLVVTDTHTTKSEFGGTTKQTKETTEERNITPNISSLDNLAEVVVNDVNVETVAKDLAILTTSEYSNITTDHLQAVSMTLQNIANVQQVNDQIVVLSLTAVDNILDLDTTILQKDQEGSTTLMVQSLQKILANLDLKPDGDQFTSSKKHIALVALSTQATDAYSGITFNVKAEPKDRDGTIDVSWSYDEYIVSSDNDTGLTFSEDLFKETDVTDIRANIIVYSNDKLFNSPQHQIDQSRGTLCKRVQSKVIGAELLVNGNQVTHLEPGVKMVYNIHERNSTLQPSCVYWDFNKSGNHGDWSNMGCHVAQDIGGQVMCICDHLTNFAVLMTPMEGCNTNSYFLDVVSKIGCVVSIISLIATFLTYMVYKNLMGRTPQLILIQWTLSLMCLYLVFLFGIDASKNDTLCTIVAALLHYFTLTSIFWMGAEAASLFLVFVKGVRVVPRPQKFLPITAAIAWGFPALLAIVPLIFMREDEYRHSKYCFLMQGPHFYFGLLLPIGIVLLINIIVFILVLNAITCKRPNISSSLQRTQTSESARMIQQVLCIAVLLGITWVFGFLSIGGAAPVFNAFFSIFNTFQGLAVFLLFCVRRREVREAWRKSFCCTHEQTYHIGQYRSRSGTAGSRSDIYNVNGYNNGYRSRSGTTCSRTDALGTSAASFDKI